MPQSMNTWPETFHKVNLIGESPVWFADLGHLQNVLMLEKNCPVSLSRSSISHDLVDL
jgi:hypothetical protein